MHRLLILYPTQVDPEEFRDYYENTHMELARKLPGVRAMTYGFDAAALNADETWACVFTADFDSIEAMAECMESPEGRTTAADVGNFANPPPMLFHFPIKMAA